MEYRKSMYMPTMRPSMDTSGSRIARFAHNISAASLTTTAAACATENSAWLYLPHNIAAAMVPSPRQCMVGFVGSRPRLSHNRTVHSSARTAAPSLVDLHLSFQPATSPFHMRRQQHNSGTNLEVEGATRLTFSLNANAEPSLGNAIAVLHHAQFSKNSIENQYLFLSRIQA